MLRRLLLQSSFLTLAGCSILPERPPLKLYSISLGAPTYRNSISKRRLSSVRVNPPMVAEPYDSSKIYVLGEDNRMFNTEISQLVSTPSQIIAAAIREKLSAGGPWRIVLLPNSIAQFDYQLTIFISEFYISAVSKPYQAKVALQASVTTTAFDKLVYQRQFSAASDIEKAEIPLAVKGLENAINTVLNELTVSLNESL